MPSQNIVRVTLEELKTLYADNTLKHCTKYVFFQDKWSIHIFVTSTGVFTGRIVLTSNRDSIWESKDLQVTHNLMVVVYGKAEVLFFSKKLYPLLDSLRLKIQELEKYIKDNNYNYLN